VDATVRMIQYFGTKRHLFREAVAFSMEAGTLTVGGDPAASADKGVFALGNVTDSSAWQ
jgi:hypothetical protein